VDPEDGLSSIRQAANGRHFAVQTYHPEVGRVDSETFWWIWLDGNNQALKRSAQLSALFNTVAAEILMMAAADRSAPPMLIAVCAQLLQQQRPTGEEGWAAVPASLLRRLQQALQEVQQEP